MSLIRGHRERTVKFTTTFSLQEHMALTPAVLLVDKRIIEATSAMNWLTNELITSPALYKE